MGGIGGGVVVVVHTSWLIRFQAVVLFMIAAGIFIAANPFMVNGNKS